MGLGYGHQGITIYTVTAYELWGEGVWGEGVGGGEGVRGGLTSCSYTLHTADGLSTAEGALTRPPGLG